MVNAVIIIGWEPQSTRFRPLSISIPPPLFPIGGYPMIFHHVKALSNLADVKNVFLMGCYDEKKFIPFLDYVKTLFTFKIHYIKEEIEYNSPGGLFFYKDVILQDSPKAVFVMHCDICCSFPLYDMLKQHRNIDSMFTIMTKQVEKDQAKKYGQIVYESSTQKLMHFAEKSDLYISDMINCGVYLVSSKIFYHEQFEKIGNKYKRILELSQDAESSEKLSKQQVTRIDFKNLCSFNEFASQSVINYCTEFIKFKDMINLVCNLGIGTIFILDQSKHFWQQVKTTKQLLYTQETYLNYYKEVDQNILTHPPTMKDEQIEGIVCIHPTAEIHQDAKIGPNVTIGAYAKIGDGARIINSIILEDVIVQPHAVIINSIIGWTTVIGSWARIEGLLNKADCDKMMSKKIVSDDEPEDYYHNISNHPSCQEQQRVLKNGVTTVGGGVFVEPELHLRNVVVLPFRTVTESYFHQIIV